MNIEIEEKFLKEYIQKERRDRIYHELTNAKKRESAIMRFNHGAEKYLIKTKIQYQGIDRTKVMDFINHSSEKECYIISLDDEIDGSIYPASEALDRIDYTGMASIAIFKDFSIIKTEQEQGAAEIFIVKSNRD